MSRSAHGGALVSCHHFSMSAESSTPGPSDVDQSTFERWRRKFSMITGLGGTQEQREADMEAHHHKKCEKWKRELMTYSQYQCVHGLISLLLSY